MTEKKIMSENENEQVEATAIAALALMRVKPASPQLKLAVDYLTAPGSNSPPPRILTTPALYLPARGSVD